jgi:hypothetical protein
MRSVLSPVWHRVQLHLSLVSMACIKNSTRPSGGAAFIGSGAEELYLGDQAMRVRIGMVRVEVPIPEASTLDPQL